MTLDKVVNEIISKAKADANALKKEGKVEAISILKKAKTNASEIEDDAIDYAKGVVEAMEKKELASAKLQCKRIELDSRKDVIDKVFDKLREKVMMLDDKTKKNIYEKMIKKAVSEMVDARYVYANAKDKGLVNSVAAGLDVKEADILGGVIVEDKDQNVRIDCTFESVLEDVRDEYLKDISKVLFE